jgi:phosphatidylserine/phosphatidylglycerophosphate/cardiolipin synthase-like enzyme
VERVVRVQPLLTPDNYQSHVLKLIESAEEQILFQNQSFSILDDPKNDSRYEQLFQALLAKQEEGIDLRIIVRGEFDAEKTVERLKKRGFNTNRIRLQDRCHTKGIIVDRKAALVGSHNWTNQGTLVNRDASLIFFDEEIARYFADIFWFDWKKLARKSVSGGRRMRVADGREAPAGTVRVSLRDLLYG